MKKQNMNRDWIATARTLSEALPYLQRYSGAVVVVKFGGNAMGDDEAMLRYVTSANVACGFHAGDPGVMRATVALAREHGVAVGAHPGFPDPEGFGRRELQFSPSDVEDFVESLTMADQLEFASSLTAMISCELAVADDE